MQRHFLRWSTIIIIFIAPIFLINTKYILAGKLKEEAESYREQGYKAQQTGEIDEAISWYQKAASLDPDYAAPHNDLGILFEAKGWLDRAEVEYQKALSIDSDYAKAHSNLALLYERKGELEKAAFHWMRRYKLGVSDDPWTIEARERLEKIGLLEKKEAKKAAEMPALPKTEQGDERKMSKAKKLVPEVKEKKEVKHKERQDKNAEKAETSGWTLLGSRPEVPEKKEIARPAKKIKVEQRARQIPKPKKSGLDKELQESLRLAEERLRQEKSKKAGAEEGPVKGGGRESSDPTARAYYAKANNYFQKGEYSRALDEIRGAKKSYPDDTSLLQLEESVKNRMKEERIKDHYNEGMMRYREDNFSGARKEFEAILNILPE